MLYKLLNQECQQTNLEKKQKVVQRSAKKGIVIKEKDVNLLKPDDSAQENNSSSDEAADEVDEAEFSIKLKQGKAV